MSIDRERVINTHDHGILNELLCPICFCLLWKPRSCSTCQHLFCYQCIQTWLNENINTCPLCRSLYEEKLAPPLIQSVLSHYSIRCRNSSFGCQGILSYDCLEQHENLECKYLTKKCSICEQFILEVDLKEHKNSCKPLVMQCPFCQYSIKTELFDYHYEACLSKHTNVYDESFDFSNEVTASTVDLIGTEIFNQSRDKNCLLRFYAMIQLVLYNLPIIHLILLNFFGWGCGNLIRILTISFLCFQSYIHRSSHRGFLCLLSLTYLFHYFLFYLFQTVNDICMVSFIVIGLIIWSSINPKIQVNQFQINFNIKEILLFFILIFLLFEIPILIIRLYFYQIPIYIGTICTALSIFHFA